MWLDGLRQWFVINRPVVLFVCGQVFFVMGLAILLQTRRYSRLALARSMPWLALFGLLHGFYQWGNLFIPLHQRYASEGVIAILEALQLLLLAGSFGALFQFGVQLMRPLPERWRWVKSLPLFLFLLWLAVPFYLGLALGHGVAHWHCTAEILARYMLGAPGAVAAAWGLRRQAKARLLPLDFPSIYNLLRVAGVALLGYALLAGVIVPQADFFPARWLNEVNLQHWLALPVEAFQAADGLVLAAAVIMGLEVFEFETERLIERMEQAQVVAIERERIARDLHDGAIQQVYAAGLVAQSLRNRIQDPEMGKELERLMAGINAAIAELRRFLVELRGQETPRLTTALGALVDEAQRISGTEIYLETDDHVPTVSPEIAAHILSFAREALSNAIRHARSPLIEVRLACDHAAHRLRLEVEDHGIGLPDDPDPGFGLRNMRDRARLLGGTLAFQTRRGQGTKVILTVPLESDRN